VWDESPEAIVALDPEWRYQYLNAAALVMLGLTADVLGRDSRDIHPEASASAFGAAYLRVMSSRVGETVERHYQPLDTYLNALVSPWPGSGIVIVLRDVTEERRPQARLRRNHDLYQQLLDQTTQSLTLRDLEGRFLLVNRAAAARLGHPAEELLGRLSSEIFTPEVDQALREADRVVQQTGEPQDNPAAQLLRADRKVVSQVFPVRDDDDVLIGLGTLAADVTELAEAQADLAASQHRFRRVFASTSLGIVVTRESGEIVEVNSALCRLLGYSRDALLAMPATSLVPASRRDEAARWRRLQNDAGEGYELEDEFVRSDGQLVPVLLTVNSFHDPAGRGHLISCVVRDLTSLHQLQAQVVSAERMKAVGRLAAGIAHDSNNILAAVSGYAELLADEVEELPVARRHLDGIVRSVQRACDMVTGLLAFTRDQPMQPVLVDLAELVLDLEDMLRQLLPSGVRLELDLQPALARVDSSQIRQVVLNLVVNARDAVDGAGSIRISTGRDDSAAVVLSVADDGPGMTPEVARRCFEPFFTTRAASGGSGIGLSTAHGIAGQSGGDLRVATAIGRGTTFELRLPLAEPAAPSGSAPAAAGATVLVADDDPEVRSLMLLTLEAAGYQVRLAENGAEALAAAAGADLVVSDLDMPLMNGLELAERLAIRLPPIPVLLVSGAGSRPAGAELPFLSKPFTRAALVRAVQASLAAAR
jgi:PAS domain S-box-containing protein